MKQSKERSWLRPTVMLPLVAASTVMPLSGAQAQSAAAQQPYVLTTRFTYTATVPEVAANTKELRVWLPLPSNSEWQTVEDLKVEAAVPHRVNQEKKHGNRMVYLAFAKPQAPVSVTVQFTVKRKKIELLGAPGGKAGRVEERDKNAWSLALNPDAKVPIGGRYADMAKQIALGKALPLERMRAIFDNTVATMQYDYKKESPKLGEGDVAFVCDYKKGNCSDLHSYVISMARSLNIPAVLEYGFPITGIPQTDPLPREGKISGYHCWTWFRDPQRGWLPLDASDARRWLDSGKADLKDYLFGNLIPERSAVAFSRGRDINLVPVQKAAPLNYFIYPYAEADGKSAKADWVLNYQLLERTTVASRPE